MNKNETLMIMAILKEAYPVYYKDKTKEEAIASINLWHEMFVDDDFAMVKAAIKRHIATDTKGFPPVIGQIRDSLRKLQAPEELSEQEAINLIIKATSRSAYNSVEEFEKLTPTLKRLVGSPAQLKEWGLMPSDQFQSVIASNLMRSYKVVAAREREYFVLPAAIKTLAEGKFISLEEGEKDE